MPDPKLSLRKGAIAPWARSTSPYYMQTLEALARHFKFRLDVRFDLLPKEIQDMIFYGSGKESDALSV